jgi:hypothetical protein
MTYSRLESGQIERRIDIEGVTDKLVLRAVNVRKERTGVHATVTIGLNSTILEEDTFNVERREDRTRLGNAALKNAIIQDLAPRLKLILEHELLLFLRGLWEFEIGKNAPERRGGSYERKAPPWLLKPYILKGSGTILFGPPGRGKSWTAYAMAVMLDSGNGFFFDVPPEGAPAMIVNLERSAESVDARLADINGSLGLPREREILRLDRRGRKFQDVADSVARVVEREGVALVVLDSLSRAGYGDLNANEDTNRGMDALNALGTAWLAIGHTPRGDETHLFGSQMQDAAADVMVQLASEERTDQWGKAILGVGVKGMKANDVRRPPLTILAYEFDDIGLTAIRKARPGEFLTIENASNAQDVRGQVTNYLKAEGEASATAISRDTGLVRATVSKILASAPEFESRKRGQSVLYRLKDSPDNEQSVHGTHQYAHKENGSVHSALPIGMHTSSDAQMEEGVQDVSTGVQEHTSDSMPFWDSSEEEDRINSLFEGSR